MLALSIAIIIGLALWLAYKADHKVEIIDPGTQLRCRIDDENVWLVLDSHEPADPAAYQWEPGWSAYDPDDDCCLYFINETGAVFKETTVEDTYAAERIVWREVGFCPAMKVHMDVWDIQMTPDDELEVMA